MDKENSKNQQTPQPHPHPHPHRTEAFGISDKELKSKDEVQKQLTITFDWMVAHKVIVLFLLAIFLLSGLGFVTYSKIKKDTELKIQDQYFVIEKKYLDQKNQFDEAEREQKAASNKPEKLDKAAKAEKKDKKDSDKKETTENKTPKALASGDLEKDYGSVVKEFNDLIRAQPTSLAAKQAALLLSDIYFDYSKYDDSLVTLSLVSKENPKDLIELLIAKKRVSALLSLDKFSEAEKELLKLINLKNYVFLNSQFKLMLGLAYEGLKQWDKAESQFQEVIAKGIEAENLPPEEMAKRNRFSSDISAYEQAQKYLILLKLKKDSEKVGT